MSGHSNVIKNSDPRTPLVARIILITVLITMFGAYVVEIYYR